MSAQVVTKHNGDYLWDFCAVYWLPDAVKHAVSGYELVGPRDRIEELQFRYNWRLGVRQMPCRGCEASGAPCSRYPTRNCSEPDHG